MLHWPGPKTERKISTAHHEYEENIEGEALELAGRFRSLIQAQAELEQAKAGGADASQAEARYHIALQGVDSAVQTAQGYVMGAESVDDASRRRKRLTDAITKKAGPVKELILARIDATEDADALLAGFVEEAGRKRAA